MKMGDLNSSATTIHQLLLRQQEWLNAVPIESEPPNRVAILLDLLQTNSQDLQQNFGPNGLFSANLEFKAVMDRIKKQTLNSTVPKGHGLIVIPNEFVLFNTLVPLAQALAKGCPVVLLLDAKLTTFAKSLNLLLSSTFPPEEIAIVLNANGIDQFLGSQKFDWIHFAGHPEKAEVFKSNLSIKKRQVFYTPPIAVIDETANIEAVTSRLVWTKTDDFRSFFPEPQKIYVQESIRRQFLLQLSAKLKKFGLEQSAEVIYEIGSYRRLSEIIAIHKADTNPLLGLFIFSRYKPTVIHLIKKMAVIGICLNEEVLSFENRSIPYGGKKQYQIAHFFQQHLARSFE